jgi:hypothetical protein
MLFVLASDTPFPDELIKAQRPDLVVYEIVERHLMYPISSVDLESDILILKAPPFQDMVTKSEGMTGGWVDFMQVAGDHIRFLGWAVDPAPAKEVYAYLGDRLVGAGEVADLRPDATVGMSDHRAGFRLRVSREFESPSADRPLRFFSVNRSGRVYELFVNPPVARQVEQFFAGGKPH